MNASMVPCFGCRTPIDPNRAVYDNQGNLVCASCAARLTIAEGEGRAVKSLIASALAVPVAGALSWSCLDLFWVVSIATAVGGIGWLRTVSRHGEYRAKMGGAYVPCFVAVIIGLVLVGMHVLYYVAFFGLALTSAALHH